MLVNVTGDASMTLHEVDEAGERIRAEVDADANIIFGTSLADEGPGAGGDSTMRVSIVATGIEHEDDFSDDDGE